MTKELTIAASVALALTIAGCGDNRSAANNPSSPDRDEHAGGSRQRFEQRDGLGLQLRGRKRKRRCRQYGNRARCSRPDGFERRPGNER